jgi:hypothetical protein
VRQGAKKVWRAIGVAVNQTAAEETMARRTFGVAGFSHQPNRPLKHFSSLLISKALMCGGLKFRTNFRP